MGGMQLQITALAPETPKNALLHPEKYQNLIVRIGGYSDYFNHLSLDVRKEMARRFVNGQ
jgi:pyruvate-formate lyase